MIFKIIFSNYNPRYREEQKTKVSLKEMQKERTKLIATLTQQDGIVKGLQAERDQWSVSLAVQTSDLAKEKGSLTAHVELLRTELEKEKENRTTLKIKEKEIDAANLNIRDLKMKLTQMTTRAQEAEVLIIEFHAFIYIFLFFFFSPKKNSASPIGAKISMSSIP